jgi:hypothetical protein
MRKKAICLALSTMLFAISFPVLAQQPKKLHRIGILLVGSSSFYSAWIDVFRQGLKEFGVTPWNWTEKEVKLECRW